jgi:heat shock protein HslJ
MGALGLAFAVVSVVLAGCCVAPATGGLEGVDWVLEGTSVSSIDYRTLGVTARFEDGKVGGSSGVNSYGSDYTAGAGGSLKMGAISATLRGGSPEAMRAEQVYLELLAAVRSYKVADGRLTLYGEGGNELLAFTKSTGQKPPEPAGAAPGGTETSNVPSTGGGLSSESIAYARSIGGSSREGETLYFVVGASYPTESAAASALTEAQHLFGDMQSYFIVQKADNLEVLPAGKWVLVEAYRAPPDESNLQLARRAFPNATVQQAVVRTSDPIPVYEDAVGLGEPPVQAP